MRGLGLLFGQQGRDPEEIRDAVDLFDGDVAAKQSRFWLLLTLAACIATAGVVSDSTATVIGAMIVAPLATPIQGIGWSIAFGHAGALLRSASLLAAAVLAVIALGLALGELLPTLTPLDKNSQVTSRISPTVVDLFAASATGLAGAFAVSRRDIADIIPGVAIAISLVPPLAVVGLTAGAGEWAHAGGAMLLFVTNVLAIIVGSIVVFTAVRVHVGADRHGRTSRPVYALVAGATVAVAAALALSTYHTVERAGWTSAAQTTAGRWAERNGERLLSTRYQGDTLVFVVQGTTDGAQDHQLPSLLRGAVPAGTPILVDRLAGDVALVADVPR